MLPSRVFDQLKNLTIVLFIVFACASLVHPVHYIGVFISLFAFYVFSTLDSRARHHAKTARAKIDFLNSRLEQVQQSANTTAILLEKLRADVKQQLASDATAARLAKLESEIEQLRTASQLAKLRA